MPTSRVFFRYVWRRKRLEYFKKLNENVKFYGKRGKDPQEKTVAGEFGLGIIPIDKSSFDVAQKII